MVIDKVFEIFMIETRIFSRNRKYENFSKKTDVA